MGTITTIDKLTIRKVYRHRRFELTEKEVQKKSKQISNNFIKNLLPKISNFNNKKLAFYLPINNEVNPTLIVKHCNRLGNIISLPKISNNNSILDFKSYKIGDNLVKNFKYSNLLEPEQEKLTIIPDIIFVPLIAFNNECYRVGMGGGFYDFTINFYRKQVASQKTIFIGLAYEWQKCQELFQEKWDQKLDFIVLEKTIVHCSQYQQ